MDEQQPDESPLLSFAIPTYNFGRFITETVRTIQDGAQLLSSEQFEIVILDGGSKDETDEAVASLMDQYNNIRYVKQEQRGGIDRDMDTVASLAKGAYIWLFSADDLLVPGWDRKLIPQLESTPEVVLVPAVLCDLLMQPLRPNPIFRDCTGTDPIQFHFDETDESRSRYLDRIATLEAVFSFMSAIVINRNVWNGLTSREDYFGSCWAHCARMMPLLFRSCIIIYLNNYLIKKRGGNDSFMENGFVSRIGIAVDGWDRIIQEYFLNPSHQRTLYSALCRDMPVLLFIYAKISSRNSEEIKQLRKLAHLLYSSADLSPLSRVYYFIFRITPASPTLNSIISPALPLLVKLRHKTKSLLPR